MMWGYDGFGFGAGAMGIGMLVFWGLIVVAVVLLARGEIDKNEFEQKRRDLCA